MKSRKNTKKYKIELLVQAEDEMSESYDYYEAEQTSLGDKFYREINHHLNLIESNPYHHPIRFIEELRALPLKKFPFLIIYWIDEVNQTVFVVSIFHTSRRPNY